LSKGSASIRQGWRSARRVHVRVWPQPVGHSLLRFLAERPVMTRYCCFNPMAGKFFMRCVRLRARWPAAHGQPESAGCACHPANASTAICYCSAAFPDRPKGRRHEASPLPSSRKPLHAPGSCSSRIVCPVGAVSKNDMVVVSGQRRVDQQRGELVEAAISWCMRRTTILRCLSPPLRATRLAPGQRCGRDRLAPLLEGRFPARPGEVRAGMAVMRLPIVIEHLPDIGSRIGADQQHALSGFGQQD